MNELLFGVQYILLGAYTGAALNFIGCVRNTIFAKQVQNGKKTIFSRIAFSCLFFLMVAFTWNGPKSLLVGIAKIASTFAYGCKNTVIMRIVILLTSTSWFIYNAMINSIAGMICEAFTIISIIVALIRMKGEAGTKEL